MKIKMNKLLRKATALLLALCISIPCNSMVVAAADTSATKASMTFIPFRDQIPYYLSTNSDSKSDLIKKLWVKIFYEELNWNSSHNFYDSKYKAWWNKYKGTTYIGLNGAQKNLSGQITYSTGDFEAFFGNTLEANPEFLGQLLGLNGYEFLSTKENEKSFFRNVIGKYLLDTSGPSRYDKYFVNNIVNLTKKGKYLDGSLTTVYCNGIRADYCMLSTLASRYRKTDLFGNQYLSSQQISWVESYQKELYKAYTTGSNQTLKNLVVTNSNLYDLIARSKDAANNLNGFGQIFFNYVVSSGKGAGAWLNLSDKINIPAMSGIDDISGVFALSNGWCGQRSNSECYNRNNCQVHATTNDKIAYELYKNGQACQYILNNPATRAAFGSSKDDTNGWWYRYTVKHTKWNPATGPVNIQGINAASGISSRGVCHSSKPRNTGNGLVTCSALATITVNTRDLLFKEATKTGSNSPKTVTIGVWYEASIRGVESIANAYKANKNNKNNDSVEYIKKISFDCSPGIIPPESGVADYNYTGTQPETYAGFSACRYYTFDVSNLSYNQLLNGYININTAAGNSAYATARGEDEWSYCSCGAMPTVYITSPIADCDINGHAYDVRSAAWAPDYSYADITYTCSKDKTHVRTVRTKNITATPSAGIITYKVIGMYNEPYTKVTYAGGSSASVVSRANLSAANATDYYSSNTSGKVIDYHQSEGKYATFLVTYASASIKGSIKPGVIPVGVRKITFNYVASERLEELIISVHSSTGKVIGRGGTNMADTIDKSKGTITLNLYASSDLDLYNSYVTITGKASTEHITTQTLGTPSLSTATIGVTSLIFTY